MKNSNKIISIMLAGFVVAGICGCKSSDKGGTGKTTLNVGVYDSGVDASWMEEMEKEYEKLHPDIDIEIDKRKSDFEHQQLQHTIETDVNDMYVTHIVPVRTWAKKGYILDVTDVMQGKAAENEDKTLEEKCITPNILDYFKSDDGKYYGIPFYTALTGAIYDVDLFEQKNLYLMENGKKTKGIDGIEGTSDDGLPVTYDEFKKMCNSMKLRGINPFTWSYMAPCNKDNFLNACIASYEGLNDFMLNYTLEGTDSQFGEITVENANKLIGQQGRVYAATMAHDIIRNGWFRENECYNTSQTHILAQESFLYSRAENEPTAMLFDGSWWENEAYKTGIFDDVVDAWGKEYAYGDRRFAFMPIPLFDENHSKENTLYNCNAGTSMIINAKTKKPELAKDFLRFINTKQAMCIFNSKTGQVRPYEYELSEEEYNSLTYFSQSLYTTLKKENHSVANNLTISPIIEADSNYFSSWLFKTKIGGEVSNEMFNTFYNNKDFTVEEFIAGAKLCYSNWDAKVAEWKGI